VTKVRFAVFSWAAITLILCIGDRFFHVRTGILHYNWEPIVDGQSAWVWLVFAGAAAAMLAITIPFPQRDIPLAVPRRDILTSTAIFVVVYALTGMFGESHPTVLFAALVAAWLGRVLIRGEDRLVYLIHGVVLATGGVVGEGLFSRAGLFAYDLQQVVDCPWWLGALYLHGSIALLQVGRGWKSLGRSSVGRPAGA